MNCLFEHFHGFDIQATRKEGGERLLINQVCKKLRKGMTVSQIASDLEEDEPRIRAIVNISEKYAPEYNCEEIFRDVFAPEEGR